MPLTLPSEFTAQTDRMALVARQKGAAGRLPGIAQTSWLLPVGAVGDPGLPGVLVVNRPVCNSMYDTSLTTGADETNYGRLAELIGLKSAIDYLGCYERALLAEYAGRNRAIRWAAARRDGQGDATYGAYAAVRRDLEYTLAAAGN